MFQTISRAAPTFTRSGVTVDWSAERLHRKFDAQSLLSWVQSSPVKNEVHVYLGNVHFTGQRPLQRRLLAMGCTVTCRQYQSACT
ncbi:hypothetical protein FJZ28_04220 [Candidatus Peregrinibacteria bacterium]|nr:hypothetical protein [Candidatus Peregrinibacteria bacterium]